MAQFLKQPLPHSLISICLLLAGMLATPMAHSHSTPVASLDIREGRSGVQWLEWTYYSANSDKPPGVQWPPHCTETYPRLDCGEQGLVGLITMPEIGEQYSAAVVKVHPQTGAMRTYTLTGGNRSLMLTLDGKLPWRSVAASYIPLGIEHIMLGIDHLLFVLGLIVLVRGTPMLIKTITSFTVAHSLTLAAATLGWVGVPEKPVNAAIALSIVVLAVEVLRYREGKPSISAQQPWLIAFGFGLLHGFGFAGAMNNVGLAAESLPVALLFFNIGVEVGQLAFVFLVLGLYHAHRQLNTMLPKWSATAGIYAIGGIASYWFIARTLALAT
ncbi:MAG: HupE/UreJ family protein [Pseudomonadales bacterium]|nr:HupE/UreJ family protein [Pseudomonadales bacterium]